MQRFERQIGRGALRLALAVGLLAAAAAQAEKDADQAREGGAEARSRAMRALREGETPDAALLDRLRIARAERDRVGGGRSAGRGLSAVRGNDWINLGPDNADVGQDSPGDVDSGRLRSIVPHPGNPDILFVATAGGGVWKTYDAGATWEPLTDRLGSLGSGALAMDPHNPDVLAYGFGDPFDAALEASGVSLSTDGGASWSDPKPQVVTVNGLTKVARQVRDLQIDPLDSRHLLVATDVGLFTSSDFGATWAPAALPAGRRWTGWSIGYLGSAACPSGGALCSSWLVALQQNDSQFGDVGMYLFRSSDSGATWLPVPLARGENAAAGRATIAVAPSTALNPNLARVYLLASTSASTNPYVYTDWATHDVYRSDDGGRSFRGLGVNRSGTPTNPNNDQSDLDVLHFQSWYNQAITVDPLDPDLVLIGGNLAMIRTSDGGATWSVLTDWLPASQGLPLPYIHADFQVMAAAAFPGATPGAPPIEHYYFGSDGGLFRSDDVHRAAPGAGHVSSALNKGIVSHLAYSIACAHDSWPDSLQGFAMGGLQDNGTRLRDLSPAGSGPGTFDVVFGGDGFGVGVSRNLKAGVPSLLVTTTYGGAPFSPIHVSTDGGKSFVDLIAGIDSTTLPFIMRIASDDAPDSDGETFLTFSLAAGGPSHIYRATNASALGGWLTIDGSIAYPDGTVQTAFLDPPGNALSPHALATNAKHAGFYAFSADSGFTFVTADAGAHWLASNPLGSCTTATCATRQPDSIRGATGLDFDWSDATGKTLWAGSASDVLFDAVGSPVPGGVPSSFGHLFRTTDAGLSWQPVHGGGAHLLPNVPVNTIKVDPGDAQTIYIGTYLGLYVTRDGGATFDRLGLGLPLASVTQICITPATGTLKVSTYGRGFWEIDQHAAGVAAGAKGRGDLDFNQRLDPFDLISLVAAMGTTNADDGYRQEADLVGRTSGIDDADLAAFLARFGGTP